MTARLFLKLILGTLAVLVVALVAADILVSKVAENNYRESLERELTEKGRMLSLLLGPDSASVQSRARQIATASDARLTLVAPDGAVLADSERNPKGMENHKTASRTEILWSITRHIFTCPAGEG